MVVSPTPEPKPGLRFGRVVDAVHVCVDMQRLFQAQGLWETPWMTRVLPGIVRLVERRPEQTIFTRFLTAERPGEGPGVWSRYWTKWAALTQSEIDPILLDLPPELQRFSPPATIIDKRAYSPWYRSELPAELERRRARALVISGGETDVCVLATVLSAVDRGYRVIIASDGLCSSTDRTHDAVLELYNRRFDQQIELAEIEEILDAWT